MKIAFIKHPIYEQLAEKLLEQNPSFQIDFWTEIDAEKAIATAEYDALVVNFAALRTVTPTYEPIECGALLSTQSGPFLITRKPQAKGESINSVTCQVGIEGVNNTPNFLFTFFYPYIQKTTNVIVPAADMENWVSEVENRMCLVQNETGKPYKKKGFDLVADFGKLWLERMVLPVPYTALLVKTNLDMETFINVMRAAISPMRIYDQFYHLYLFHDSEGLVAKCRKKMLEEIHVEW